MTLSLYEHEEENSYRSIARAKKVDSMVAAIDSAAKSRGWDIYEDADKILASLEKYTEANWAIVDKVSKVKRKSSDETRKAVKQIYRDRAETTPF